MIHNWENYFDTSSEYWKKVEKIYEENESFPKKVVKERNLHHKFPRSFSKKDGVDVDNDEDNLVSLSLADHFRVHYYLWKCAKKGYRSMMAMAFTLMRKKAVVYATDETIEQIARDYENAMKDAAEVKSRANKGKKRSEETRKKLSKAHKGKPKSEEQKKKQSEAMKGKHTGENNPMYGKHHTDEAKERMSKALSGEKHPMYGKHLSEEQKKRMSEAHKGEKNPNYGKHFSEEHKNKLSTANKGKCWFNNGKINTMAKECPEGFIPGMLK